MCYAFKLCEQLLVWLLCDRVGELGSVRAGAGLSMLLGPALPGSVPAQHMLKLSSSASHPSRLEQSIAIQSPGLVGISGCI